MKIKTLEFQITVFVCASYDENTTGYRRARYNDLYSLEEVDKAINQEIEGKEVARIDINYYTKSWRNNSGGGYNYGKSYYHL